MGVTGARTSVSSGAEALVARTRAVTDLPIAVGLGVSTREQAKDVARYADGVIVGYAAFIVQTHIHYQDALVAANSAVYAVPEVRAGRVVLKLLRFAEMGLKAQGVQKIYYHVKQTKDFGRLLGHLGYQDVERMYAKVVQDRKVE